MMQKNTFFVNKNVICCNSCLVVGHALDKAIMTICQEVLKCISTTSTLVVVELQVLSCLGLRVMLVTVRPCNASWDL